MGLTRAGPTRATLDSTGIELSVDGAVPELHEWNEISAMERAGKDWQLVGPDASVVAMIPYRLAHPRPSWSDAPTLAEAIVEMRPDRYALRGGSWEPGLTEFGIREPGDPVGRLRRTDRPKLLRLGIVLAVVAFVLLSWMLSQKP